ncbi:uncharacterized protein LOC141904385 [Tubulanus polymorphus]|uniref:uncharacterized protein LOC141904385 n=1 Tax=Tubulanus polymorphus TaxID=672921 RepID=UPI003DA59CE2
MGLKVHKDSHPALKSELDIFSLPMTNITMESAHYAKYQPLATITDSGNIDFLITGNSQHYLDLNHTWLDATFKIVKGDGSPMNNDKADDPVATLINYAQSLFSDVEVRFNDKLISNGMDLHPIRAAIENLIFCQSSTKPGWMESAMIYKDEAGRMNDTDPRSANCNSGLKERYDLLKKPNNLVKAQLRLHSDAFGLDKLLLSNVTVKVKLIRSKDAFCLMSPNPDVKFKVKIENATLNVRRVQLSPSVQLAHEKALATSNAKYHFVKTSIFPVNIPRGVRSVIRDNLIIGNLPRNIIIGFCSDESLSGSYDKNPFDFKHYDIARIAVSINGSQVEASAINFESKDLSEGYFSLFTGTGILYQDKTIGITRKDYANGYFLTAFDLTPDFGFSDLAISKKGSLRVELEFSKPLPENINLLLYANFDEVLEITKDRTVVTDF